jgi:uncharacterized membrane protein
VSVVDTISKGDSSRVSDPRRVVVRDDEAWRALWAAHAGSDVTPPHVDFVNRIVAGVFAGDVPSAGHSVSIDLVRRDGDVLTVLVEERRPAPGTVVAQVILSPFHIVSLSRFDGEVRFENANTVDVPKRPAAAPVLPTRRRQGRNPSSTGLEPPIAGALAYVAGPFSGVLLLGVERTSHFVRFHAWQSVMGLGSLGVLAVASLVLAFMLLVISPTAFWTMLWVSAILGWGWLVLWVVCVVQAYRGRRWKMPLVGGYAEELANR